eukprot:3238633-Pyramimonas_sp.AAC.3
MEVSVLKACTLFVYTLFRGVRECSKYSSLGSCPPQNVATKRLEWTVTGAKCESLIVVPHHIVRSGTHAAPEKVQDRAAYAPFQLV